MSCPIGEEQLTELKKFVEICKSHPQLLHNPKLAFFKEYLTGLGANIPLPDIDAKNYSASSGDGWVCFLWKMNCSRNFNKRKTGHVAIMDNTCYLGHRGHNSKKAVHFMAACYAYTTQLFISFNIMITIQTLAWQFINLVLSLNSNIPWL